MKKKTSWGHVAPWYNTHLKEGGTYQESLILPNLIRLLDIGPGEKILDIGCGQGFFAREFHKAGAQVTGVDISQELIAIAKKTSPKEIQYTVGSADSLPFKGRGLFDKAVIILAIQNIENLKGTIEECRRVVRDWGHLHIVMNHPAFRIPKASAWGWDEEAKTQYRRIDRYLSEASVRISMHPGDDPRQYTISFHRPLQSYFKAMGKAGFGVTRLEEWNSNRVSGPGPRADAENRARKEIPLFLYMKAIALPEGI